jgi:pyridoxal biosynthesis lyase PdxS
VGGLGGALYDFGRDLAEMVRGRPKGGTEDVVQAINHLEKSFVGAVGSLRDALTASAVPDRGWTDLEESGDRASEFTE